MVVDSQGKFLVPNYFTERKCTRENQMQFRLMQMLTLIKVARKSNPLCIYIFTIPAKIVLDEWDLDML